TLYLHTVSTIAFLRHHILVSTHVHLHYPHSFPTRRSSDLRRDASSPLRTRQEQVEPFPRYRRAGRAGCCDPWDSELPRQPSGQRSEEHTSELQSRFELVCRLLLE